MRKAVLEVEILSHQRLFENGVPSGFVAQVSVNGVKATWNGHLIQPGSPVCIWDPISERWYSPC